MLLVIFGKTWDDVVDIINVMYNILKDIHVNVWGELRKKNELLRWKKMKWKVIWVTIGFGGKIGIFGGYLDKLGSYPCNIL